MAAAVAAARPPVGSGRAAHRPAPAFPGGRRRRALAGAEGLEGLSILKPPYGVMAAIDVNKGTLKWQVPHGDTPDNVRNHPLLKGIEHPEDRSGRQRRRAHHQDAGDRRRPAVHRLATACRGASLRAYDKKTGEQVGEVRMPAPISGSPMTYSVDGRQYIVVAVSGGGLYGRVHLVRPAANRSTHNRAFATVARACSADLQVRERNMEHVARTLRSAFRSASEESEGRRIPPFVFFDSIGAY